MNRIHTLDLRYQDLQGAAASHLIRTDDGPMLVETGPMSTLPALRSELEAAEVDPESIELVVLTHIHLDHAGAAGWFAERGADVLVHPAGARHLIDPSRLNASARRIYGEDLDRMFGEMHACPAERVHAIEDRRRISFGGIDLVAIETLGHASHHHAWMLDLNGMRQCFTGDVAGMRIPGTDFVTLPLAPPEFDPEQWIKSVDLLDALDFDRIHLTHFGAVDAPRRHLARARDRILRETDLVTRLLGDGSLDDDARILMYRHWLEEESDGQEIPETLFRTFVNRALLSMNLMGVRRHLKTRPGES